MDPTCTRCGRDDGTALLLVKDRPYCPRCWVTRRRRNDRLIAGFFVALGGWFLLQGAWAVVAGFVLSTLGPAQLLEIGATSIVAVALLRGRAVTILVGRGRLLRAWGIAPRVVVRARFIGYAGVGYLVGRPVSAARHTRYGRLTRLALIVPLLLVWGTGPAFVGGLVTGCLAPLASGLFQRVTADGYDAYAVAAMAATDHVRRLLVAGEVEDALAASADVIAAYPDDPDPWIVRADALADAGDLAGSAAAASHWKVASRPGEGAMLAASYAWAVATGDLPDVEGAWLAVRWALHGRPSVAIVSYAAVLARSGFTEDALLLARYAARALVVEERWDARARALLQA